MAGWIVCRAHAHMPGNSADGLREDTLSSHPSGGWLRERGRRISVLVRRSPRLCRGRAPIGSDAPRWPHPSYRGEGRRRYPAERIRSAAGHRDRQRCCRPRPSPLEVGWESALLTLDRRKLEAPRNRGAFNFWLSWRERFEWEIELSSTRIAHGVVDGRVGPHPQQVRGLMIEPHRL
jgi:hypothetical protein